jgi:putative autotransporter adhesin-like protein
MSMRVATLAAAAAVGVALGACTSHAREGDEARAEREFPVGPFERIALAGSDDVVVRTGAAPSVRAEGDAEALERVEIEVRDGQLRIGSRSRGGWNWFGHSRRGVTVHVTVPSLTEAALTGSGDMRIDRVEGERFGASVTGSGDLRIDAARVRQASFSVTGSGTLRAAGSAGQAQLSLTGSGDMDLAAFETQSADVGVMGSGNARLRATQTASVSLRGSGNVSVAGGARCSVSKSGSGDVHCA